MTPQEMLFDMLGGLAQSMFFIFYLVLPIYLMMRMSRNAYLANKRHREIIWHLTRRNQP